MQAPETQARHATGFLADWYAENLRPKLTRAVREGRVDPLEAVALDRTMADLLAGNHERRGRPHDRAREAVSA